jgi:hypothetical protein
MVSLSAQTVESFLVHVFWLEQDRFHEVVACSQPCPDFHSLSHKAVWLAFLLAGISKIITVSTKKVFPGTIEKPYPLPASGTQKPGSESAIVTTCPIKRDYLFDIFPFAAMRTVPIIKNHAIMFHPVTDGASFFIAA